MEGGKFGIMKLVGLKGDSSRCVALRREVSGGVAGVVVIRRVGQVGSCTVNGGLASTGRGGRVFDRRESSVPDDHKEWVVSPEDENI